MVGRVHLFARTEMATDCEACGLRFDLIAGGACTRCRRVLCAVHLHGSWLRRLMVDFGAAPVCLDCRRRQARGA
jgi:hypothetical protein